MSSGPQRGEGTESLDRAPEHGHSARRRFGAIAIDQALAGGSNVLIVIMAARTLSVHDFGLFSIVFLTWVLAQSAARSMVGDPLLIHPREATERPRDAIGSALVIGLIEGSIIILAGLGILVWGDRDLGGGLIVLGLFSPLLGVQDLGRYIAFATRQAWLAVVLDLTWLAVMVAAVVGAAVVTNLTLPGLALAWAGAGGVAGLITLWRYRKHRIRLSLFWLRETWEFSSRYLVSLVANQGTALAASFALGGIAGASALGAVRGAVLLVRPGMTFHIAAISSGVSEIARSRASNGAVRRQAARISAVVSGIAAINLMVLLLLPEGLGVVVLGDTWYRAQELLLPAGIHLVLVGLWTGARAGLLGLRAVETTVVLDVIFVPITLVLSVLGAVIAGGPGYYWGVVVSQALLSTAWWVRFVQLTRDKPSEDVVASM